MEDKAFPLEHPASQVGEKPGPVTAALETVHSLGAWSQCVTVRHVTRSSLELFRSHILFSLWLGTWW